MQRTNVYPFDNFSPFPTKRWLFHIQLSSLLPPFKQRIALQSFYTSFVNFMHFSSVDESLTSFLYYYVYTFIAAIFHLGVFQIETLTISAGKWFGCVHFEIRRCARIWMQREFWSYKGSSTRVVFAIGTCHLSRRVIAPSNRQFSGFLLVPLVAKSVPDFVKQRSQTSFSRSNLAFLQGKIELLPYLFNCGESHFFIQINPRVEPIKSGKYGRK